VKKLLPLAAGLALLTSGCLLTLFGYPPHVFRGTPPPGIEGRAIAVGAQAPSFELPTSSGATFSLKEALSHGPVVLVFYRGHW
jgi:hypothetical protein